MITNGFFYLSILVGMAAIVAVMEKESKSKFFKYVPGIVLIYIIGALLQTFGFFSDNASLDQTYGNVRGALLPAMIVLMLVNCDLRKLVKLGPKMLLGYLTAVVSIVSGFVITYLIFKSFYAPETWQAFGALTGSWTGGSANMVIIQGILDVPENIFGYALIMDTVNYSAWVMFMFWLVPFVTRFNRWSKADTSHIDQVRQEIEADEGPQKNTTFVHLMGLIGLGIFVSGAATQIGNVMPEVGTVVNSTTWTITIASIVGLILAMTRVSKVPGSLDLANVMLYVIIALIASHADFSQIFQAPIYIISGFMILIIHGAVMFLLAKVFKLDLFTLGVSSLANIGGMATAPILAGTFSRSLIPIGVLMALAGSFFGTYIGLLTAKILSFL